MLRGKEKSFSSLGWLVGQQAGGEEGPAAGAGHRRAGRVRRAVPHLCFSSRALSTLALSSALIWSEMTICSTTWWATPGRVCWSRSKSTAPGIRTTRRGPHPQARRKGGDGREGGRAGARAAK